MKFFIVYCHPEPNSFNGAMFQRACQALEDAGHEVKTSDLLAMNFDPWSSRDNFSTIKDPGYLKLQLEELHATSEGSFSEEIENEIAKMEWCDIMIWQFPLWWFGLPAGLKGWVDRVYAMGRTYSHSKSFDNGAFKGKKAMLSLTTGGSSDAYQTGGFMGDLLEILRPIHRGMLNFTGWSVLKPHVVYAPVRKSDEEREQELQAYAERLLRLADEPIIEITAY